MSVYLFATLDTKGAEAEFARQGLLDLGLSVTLVDVGCLATDDRITADIDRAAVFAAAGTSLSEITNRKDRGAAVTAAACGAERLAAAAYAEGKLEGVLAIGGSAGTTIGTQAMRALPLGVPKVMLSTLASGQVRPWVGDKDILMLNSVVDIAGVNRISRIVLRNAAHAMTGLVKFSLASDQSTGATDRPVIAASMFGVTTPCVDRSRQILEQAGYEVLVFHATGSGGQAMESLIREGLIAGVLDITTTELADELVGGILSAGPNRLTAAAEMGVPQVVSVGALDMVNFGPRATVPSKFHDRKFYEHNATVTLMRTTAAENRELGLQLGRKLSAATAPAAILMPLRGLSALDAEGGPFEDHAVRTALFDAIRESTRSEQYREIDAHINDQEFATAAASELLRMLSR